MGPARKRGWRIAALVSKPTPSIRRRVHELLVVDPSDGAGAVARVLEFARRKPIDACLTRFESYVELAGRVAEALGVRGPSPTAAKATRDKLAMREAFARAGIAQPRFAPVREAADLERAAREIGFPLLVKPIAGSHSRYIAAARSPADLDGLFERVDAAVKRDKRLLFRGGGACFVAEELIEGRQVTTTSVVVGSRVQHLALADVITARDRGEDAFYLYARTTPSRISEADALAARDLATRAIAALGLEDTAVHPEIILTRDGPKMIEVAARVGGYRATMTRAAFGIDLDDAAVAIACGLAPDLAPQRTRAATAIELWPATAGIVTRHFDLEALRRRPGVHALRVRVPIGSRYDPPPLGGIPAATFTVEAADPIGAEAFAEEIVRTLDLRLTPIA